jgi:hypothetical protein
MERAARLEDMSCALNHLFRRLTFCANRELLYDLYPYVWDMRGVVSLLNSYVKWLGKIAFISLNHTFPHVSYCKAFLAQGWKDNWFQSFHSMMRCPVFPESGVLMHCIFYAKRKMQMHVEEITYVISERWE